MAENSDWNRADIAAALKKRGYTQAGLSIANGYDFTAVEKALQRPWPGLERIIANVLGVDPRGDLAIALWRRRAADYGVAGTSIYVSCSQAVVTATDPFLAPEPLRLLAAINELLVYAGRRAATGRNRPIHQRQLCYRSSACRTFETAPRRKTARPCAIWPCGSARLRQRPRTGARSHRLDDRTITVEGRR